LYFPPSFLQEYIHRTIIRSKLEMASDGCDVEKVAEYKACEATRRAIGLANQEARDEVDVLREQVLQQPIPTRGKGGGTEHLTDDATFRKSVEKRIRDACSSADRPGDRLAAKLNTCQTKVAQKKKSLAKMTDHIEKLREIKARVVTGKGWEMYG